MRSKRRMSAIFVNPRLNLEPSNKSHCQHGVTLEEIDGLIRVYRDGHVERSPIVANVPCTATLDHSCVTARDVIIDKITNLWARIYVPIFPNPNQQLPLLVFFHGGGFCVGSAAWSCYHQFLANLASKARCIIVSINYRLAPENCLPAAYEDGFTALMWLKQQDLNHFSSEKSWLSQCNFSSLFLAGDSAGANIAYNVAIRLGSTTHDLIKPYYLKGIILIQPFFGGETRTGSEKHSIQPANSALTSSISDAYWRLSLPVGENRDHPWCNPRATGAAKLRELRLPPIMVCISEMDILKDRNLDFCNLLISAGKRVESVVYKGVGHAFQVLHNSQLSQLRVQEMMSHLKAFINQ